jgi:hypothetical protein
VCDVFDDTVHRSGEQLVVLVVHGHDNEEFGTSSRFVMDLSEGEAVILEIVGIAVE